MSSGRNSSTTHLRHDDTANSGISSGPNRSISRNDTANGSLMEASSSRPLSRVSVSSRAGAISRQTSSASGQYERNPDRIFDFYDASVNLPAILNDPRKPRPNDFLTRTWGEGFVETTVQPSSRIIDIDMSVFRAYIHSINIREALLKGTCSLADVSGRQIAKQTSITSAELESIPQMFFSQSFSLENPITFREVFGSWKLSEKDGLKTLKLTQEKLSHFLDFVEAEIARVVSVRAEAFFGIVISHDLLQERMETSQEKVTAARQSLQAVSDISVKPAIRNMMIVQKRHNLKDILHKLQTMATISQTQLTIQMLLSNGDFVGALDLITTTRDILTTDLTGLVCFRHLSHQLTDMEKFIDKMMSMEFRRALSAHLNRSLEISTAKEQMLNKERFVAIVTGLLRQRRFNVVDWFREEALSALQATLKYVLIKQLTDHQEGDVEDGKQGKGTNEEGSLPYHLLRSLEFHGLVKLLHGLKDPLKEILVRIKAAHDVTKSLDVQFLAQESRTGARAEDTSGVTSADLNRLTTQLQELLFAVGEELQEEIVKILNKTKTWQDLRLQNDNLVPLWDILQDIAKDSEAILGVRMTVLTAQLQKLAFAFLSKFHDDRKQKLTLILDSERWTSAELPVEFQSFVDNIVDRGSFLVPLPRQRSEEVVNGDEPIRSPKAVVSSLVIGGEVYLVVGTVVLLLRMLGEYMALTEKLPSSMNIGGDLLQKVVELLKMFNSRTCQLVLGAGAMHSAGLKSITSKNLILSSRCLQLVGLFIPVVREDLVKCLSSKQKHLTKNFDTLLRDYDSHIEEVEKKLVQIFDSQLITHFSRWEATVPIPSPAFKAIVTSVKRLHDAVSEMLPQAHLERLFKSLLILFKRRLKQQIAKLSIPSDGGPQHGVVVSEIAFLRGELHSLKKLSNLSDILDDVWEK